jgi:hypothetical protein
MGSRRSGYEDTWDAFIAKIGRFSPNQKRALQEELTIDSKLALIHGVARYWVEARNAQDLADRKRQAQNRLVAEQQRLTEVRRLTPDPSAFRPYVSEATAALMPPIKVAVMSREQRKQTRESAVTFWRAIDRGRWRGRSTEQIVERARQKGTAWVAAHPYGPPVEPERLAAFANDLRRWRAGGVEPTLDERMRLYNPRAAKQIAHMLTSLH